MTYPVSLTAIGMYVPERILSNDDLSTMVETDDEWIIQRTGIRNRRIAADNEFTSDLCLSAVRDMQRRYGISIEDTELVIVCTHTPDYPFPSVSCRLQDALGLKHAGAIDLNATCAGFVYGLHVAAGLVAAGIHRKVLVVAGDTMSKIIDYSDRTTCILFGDGAGAALVERGTQMDFLAFDLGSDGSGGLDVYRAGLSEQMDGVELKGKGKVVQNGREVYRFAVQTVTEGMSKIIKKANLSLEEIDWFIPHSANMRMIESICDKSGFPRSRTLTSMAEYGNTSAASIAISLVLALDAGQIKQGNVLLLYGFGGGLVYGSLLLRWSV